MKPVDVAASFFLHFTLKTDVAIIFVRITKQNSSVLLAEMFTKASQLLATILFIIAEIKSKSSLTLGSLSLLVKCNQRIDIKTDSIKLTWHVAPKLQQNNLKLNHVRFAK